MFQTVLFALQIFENALDPHSAMEYGICWLTGTLGPSGSSYSPQRR